VLGAHLVQVYTKQTHHTLQSMTLGLKILSGLNYNHSLKVFWSQLFFGRSILMSVLSV